MRGQGDTVRFWETWSILTWERSSIHPVAWDHVACNKAAFTANKVIEGGVRFPPPEIGDRGERFYPVGPGAKSNT